MAARTVFQAPVTLTASISAHVSGAIWWTGIPPEKMPALATTMSRPPNAATAASTAAVSSSRRRTSATAVRQDTPASRTAAWTEARSPGLDPGYGTVSTGRTMSATATSAPARASARAMARSLPRAPPVTKAAWPASGLSFMSAPSCGRRLRGEQGGRIGQAAREILQEDGGRDAVHGAVVHGQAERHDLAPVQLTVPAAWLLGDAPDAEDGDLRRIQDRGERVDAVAAQAGDRERAAVQVGWREPALPGPGD